MRGLNESVTLHSLQSAFDSSTLFRMWDAVLSCIDPHYCETHGLDNSLCLPTGDSEFVTIVATDGMIFSCDEQCLVHFQTTVELPSVCVIVILLEKAVYKNCATKWFLFTNKMKLGFSPTSVGRYWKVRQDVHWEVGSGRVVGCLLLL